MATSTTCGFMKEFEQWLDETLRSKTRSNESDMDISIFLNYILSTLADDETSLEDKYETIRPFLQELNQNGSFDEQSTLEEIVNKWTSLKESGTHDVKSQPDDSLNPTDTILNMINKHKTQVTRTVKTKPSDDDAAKEYSAPSTNFHYNESSDEDDGASDKRGKSEFVNTNAQETLVRDKQNREKLAEAHAKQKEQAKKALIEQRQREADKKKKAQQKAAKVERKR